MKMKNHRLLAATTAGLLATALFGPRAAIGQMNMDMPMNHSANQSSSSTQPEQATAPATATQTVFVNYIKIQSALAQDSLQGVSASAAVILKTIQSDSAATFSVETAQASQSVSKAADLPTARQAFKILSTSLIKYRSEHNDGAAAKLVEVYCSMAKAAWLQDGTAINNPYLGRAMADCGQIIKSGSTAAPTQSGHDMSGMNHSAMQGCESMKGGEMSCCGSH